MTWTTAAVDKRVFAIAPIVMDLLNTTHSLSHHYRSLGGWTFAFKEYYELNLTERFTTPQFSKMMDIIDPLSKFWAMMASQPEKSCRYIILEMCR